MCDPRGRLSEIARQAKASRDKARLIGHEARTPEPRLHALLPLLVRFPLILLRTNEPWWRPTYGESRSNNQKGIYNWGQELLHQS